MITFHDVEKRYRVRDGYKVILDGANVHLPERNIGILGGNGAGKSTLLRMISGAEKPNAGYIDCNRRVSFPLGFAGSFNGSLTGIENALFVSRIYGQDTEAVIEFVKEFSQLEDQLYMPVSTYSSGMRARLAFGVSLAIDFEMYLVDEITAVGDARFRQRSRAAFKSKLDTAKILMVSHGMGTLREYCEAGVVLQDGKLTYYDDLEDAIRHHQDYMDVDEPREGRRQARPVGPGKNRVRNKARPGGRPKGPAAGRNTEPANAPMGGARQRPRERQTADKGPSLPPPRRDESPEGSS
ncbi:MAG: ATP-binding cassette domain-containing protein [Alphaproteobacteria bacterium]|nr:ATP-binding cassette domain-containing protein [Alphaproteobacteria bacterium]